MSPLPIPVPDPLPLPLPPGALKALLLVTFTLHLMAAIPNAGPYVEFSIEPNTWARTMYSPQLAVRDGKVALPPGPGWGVAINETWLEQSQYAVSRL